MIGVREELSPLDPFDALHDEHRSPFVVNAERVHRDDRGVLEVAGDRAFGEERDPLAHRRAVADGLDGDLAVERVLARQEDTPHAPFAERREDLEVVLTRIGAIDPRAGRGRQCPSELDGDLR